MQNRKYRPFGLPLPVLGVGAVLLAVIARLCSYLYVSLSSDIVYMGGPLPDAIYLLSEIADVAMLFCCYALIFRGVRLGGRNLVFPIILAAVVFFVSYALSFAAYSYEYVGIDYGALAMSLLYNLLVEYLRLLVLILVSVALKNPCKKRGKLEDGGLAPFSCHLCISLFSASVAVALSRAAVELFGTTIPFFETYSDVTPGEYLTVVLTYFSIVLNAVLGYFIGRALIAFISRRDAAEVSNTENISSEDN